MISKREIKREELRIRILEAAKGRIAKSGLASLRARDIAKDAGCALGGLYNVFADIDDLILHVNSATLARLGDALKQAIASADAPQDKLVALACGYLAFAVEHQNLWLALFDHKMPDGVPVPEWYFSEPTVLFSQIVEPLATLLPDRQEPELLILARTLFASVHGIISISLQERFASVPLDVLEIQLIEFTKTLMAGMILNKP